MLELLGPLLHELDLLLKFVKHVIDVIDFPPKRAYFILEFVAHVIKVAQRSGELGATACDFGVRAFAQRVIRVKAGLVDFIESFDVRVSQSVKILDFSKARLYPRSVGGRKKSEAAV